jgi:hypothetical protein
MTNTERAFLYSPALRMKSGELLGLFDLAPDVADSVLPRLIVPPTAERKGERIPMLEVGDQSPNVSRALSVHWPKRPVLLEATYLVREFGRDRMGLWLPKMFDSARKAYALPIPLVTSKDLLSHDVAAYRASIDPTAPIKLGVVFKADDLVDDENLKRVLDVIDRLGLQAEDCVAIADFPNEEFANPDVVAPIIGGVLETLQKSAQWRHIIFQGTSYPKKNLAAPGGCHVVPRNEWLAWKSAVQLDPANAHHLMFGDYAADHARMSFKAGAAAPIPHYRYATPDAWLIQRGSDKGTWSTVMRDVCRRIVQHPQFAGRNFSSADETIFQTASVGGTVGKPTDWRGINTTHHITRVVTDIGGIRGMTFRRARVSEYGDQPELF